MALNEIQANMRLENASATAHILRARATGHRHRPWLRSHHLRHRRGHHQPPTAPISSAMSPAEHLRLPDLQDVRDGVIASRIAAHAADMAKGIPGARDWDDEMSRRRKNLDWEGMFELALDPVKRATISKASHQKIAHSCSMCGKMCAVRTTNAILSGNDIHLRPGSC